MVKEYRDPAPLTKEILKFEDIKQLPSVSIQSFFNQMKDSQEKINKYAKEQHNFRKMAVPDEYLLLKFMANLLDPKIQRELQMSKTPLKLSKAVSKAAALEALGGGPLNHYPGSKRHSSESVS